MTEPQFTLSELSELRALAKEMQQGGLGFNPATVRKATITAVTLTSTPPVVSIQLSGDTTVTIPDVRINRTYVPEVGDTALILRQGRELLAWTKVADTTYTEGYIRYSRTSGQNVNHNTISKVAFPTADVTDTNLVSVSNDRDFSLQKTGIYSITGTYPWAANINGSRWAWFGLDTDSSTRYALSTNNPNNTAACVHNLALTRRFTAGTAISAYAYQDSGATQTLFPTGVAPLDINIAYLGP